MDRAGTENAFSSLHPVFSTSPLFNFLSLCSSTLVSPPCPPSVQRVLQLLLSQGQAGLSFPIRSDRSLVTATVNRSKGTRARSGKGGVMQQGRRGGRGEHAR